MKLNMTISSETGQVNLYTFVLFYYSFIILVFLYKKIKNSKILGTLLMLNKKQPLNIGRVAWSLCRFSRSLMASHSTHSDNISLHSLISRIRWSQALTPVDAGATLKLQMVRYENPSSKNYDGSCCDLFCWSNCDHIFRFSLDLGNR